MSQDHERVFIALHSFDGKVSARNLKLTYDLNNDEINFLNNFT